MKWAACLLLLVAAACGGNQSQPSAQPDAGETRDTSEARLRAAQDAECSRLCKRLTECAVEDARANLSAEELKELDLEQTSKRNTEKCNGQCLAAPLSPRQVNVMKACTDTKAAVCSEYHTCLDAAKQSG